MLTSRRISSAVSALALAFAAAAQAAPTVVYDSLGPTVPNLASQGYQATATSEFGDRVGFAGGPRGLEAVTVRMSSWALASTYANNAAFNGNALGYIHALTFNIYGAGTGAAPGALIATQTIDALVPWRPEASLACGDTRWLAGNGNCYNGFAFDVVFNFASLGIVLPEEVVFGVVFNTQTYGSSPKGAEGPYNSLNVGLSAGATTGTDVNNDAVFWNTSQGLFLTVPTNEGQFLEDVGGWQGFVPAVQFVTGEVPEPGSIALAGLALFALGVSRRKHKA